MRSLKIFSLAIFASACGTDLPVLAPTGTLYGDVQSADTTTDSDVTSADSTDAANIDVKPACISTVEVCDGIDNDCDGVTDNGFPLLGTACGLGACAGGVTVCSASQLTTACSTVTLKTKETCDGLDNDCNGVTDDDKIAGVQDKECYELGLCLSEHGDKLGTPCVGKFGACQVAGVYECDGGLLNCSTDVGGSQSKASAEKCDGIDNDCDSITDNSSNCNPGVFGQCYKEHGSELGQVCSGLYGVCATNGVKECGWEVNNTVGVICSTDVNGTASKMVDEVCGDKLDNDCDGVTDNGCDPSDLDNDGDGFTGLNDCNDNDASVYPGTPYCPAISGLTKTSYEFVLAYEGPKSTSGFADTFNWELGNSANGLQMLDCCGGNQKAFVPGTYFALDLYNKQSLVDYTYIGFNVHSFDGNGYSWDACGIDKNSGEYAVTLPKAKAYIIKYGVWKDVTATAVPMPSASQDSALKCYAAIAL